MSKEVDPVLKGLRVLDFTRMLPGPLCTMIMGDYGAEVIKVEDLQTGDPTRAVGEQSGGSGAFFQHLNRNKKSIAVDLKTGEGREICLRLAARSDILVEGFRPGVMNRLGLGYEAISKVNPRAVYASISGYGQDGSYRERSGHDINYTALAGLLWLSAAPGEPPVMPAIQVADIGGGSLAALSGILMALYSRERNGKGSFVDISMTRALLPWLAYAASYLSGEEGLPRRNSGHITGAYACYNIYETADGAYMSLGALEPGFWQKFCIAVEKPEWIPRQFDRESRDGLTGEVRELFRRKTRAEWTEFFAAHDACCEPVLDLHEAAAHPVSREGGFWIDVESRQPHFRRQPGYPLLFSGSAGSQRLPPPLHGEHTEEVLRTIGCTGAEIAKLRLNGVIRQLRPGEETDETPDPGCG